MDFLIISVRERMKYGAYVKDHGHFDPHRAILVGSLGKFLLVFCIRLPLISFNLVLPHILQEEIVDIWLRMHIWCQRFRKPVIIIFPARKSRDGWAYPMASHSAALGILLFITNHMKCRFLVTLE